MRTTRYFEEQVMPRRPYIRREWVAKVLAKPLRVEHQDDGRIRMWGEVDALGGERPHVLRVVLLEDGETVHNAFFDRNFRRD